MNRKEVSIIIPMYNSEETIWMALDSIRRQTAYSQILEVIVINDGSTDDGEKKISEFQEKYATFPLVYYSQKNLGVSAARNQGLRVAKGKYVAFLDSDDIWLEDKLRIQLDILNGNSEIVFLGCGHQEKAFQRKGKVINELYRADIHDVLWSYFPVTPSVIFRREAIEKIGYFDETQRYCEDINYYLRFLVHFNYYYLPQKLVEIDCGKKFFGEQGLTSNLKGMHQGEMKNLNELARNKYVSLPEYVFYYIYFEMKYLRRIIIRCINHYKKVRKRA